MEAYSIRSYKPGDELRLAELSNKWHGRYAGVVIRNAAYWKWSCIMRPDVEPEGVVMVTTGETILAYAVVGKLGVVYELCYENNSEAELVVTMLLKAVMSYLRRIDAEGITIHVPADDKVLQRVFDRLGFVETRWTVGSNVKCIDLSALLTEILLNASAAPSLEEPFLVQLEGPSSAGRMSVFIERGRVLRDGEPRARPIEIRTSEQTLLSIVLGGTSTSLMLLKGALHVKPFWKIHKALKLLRAISSELPWYDPLSDYV